MKRILSTSALTFLILLFSFQNSFAQAGMWTWLSGDSIQNSPPVFGIQGLPSVNNHPAGLYELCEWKDLQGNLWVYGGMSPNYCDTWRYNPVTNEWTWMQGNGLSGLAPVYGTQGVASPANTPGQRFYGSITWVDLSGNFWLFGGADYRNDLWKYDPTTNLWTWMSGSTLGSPPAVWGTQGVPSVLNMPAGRQESASGWTDANNNLWLFGGRSAGVDFVNDVWRYNIATGEWTWMHGSQAVNAFVNYGVQGTSSPSNTPGGRITYTKWYESGNFWIFGGANYPGTIDTRNDYWKYDPLINEWTWMYGSAVANSMGNYNLQCTFDNINNPAGRWEQRAAATDNCGKFWLFGGQSTNGSFNDLTLYDPQQNLLNWVSGAASNVSGIFGTKGVASASNIPPSKIGSVAWWGNDNKFYMFSGGKSSGFQCYSDMWVYAPDSTCSMSCNLLVTSSFTAPNHLCPGTCTDFTNLSLNASSYAWSFPGANPSTSTDVDPLGICYPTPGNYDVQLIATNTTGSDTLLLSNYITVYPWPSPQGITQSGDTLFAITGATFYQWYLNGNIINGATDYLYVALTGGNYNVVATDANGCEVEAAIFDVVADMSMVNGPQSTVIFPNPVADKFTIQNSIPIAIGITSGTAPQGVLRTIEISIYNVLGEKMFTALPKFQDEPLTVNCEHLPSGMYYLEITHSGKMFRTKFIKQ